MSNYISSKGELVSLEKYVWIAQYEDDTVFLQFEENPAQNLFHNFHEIDQSKLKLFRMQNMVDPNKYFDLQFNPKTMKLIHFYRGLHLEFGGKEVFVRLYCYGYEKKGSVLINIILPGDQLVTTDQKDFTLNIKLE